MVARLEIDEDADLVDRVSEISIGGADDGALQSFTGGYCLAVKA